MAAVAPDGFARVRALFLRALGVTSLMAFVSLWVQIDGLLGSRGLAPAQELLGRAREALGPASAVLRVPTLLWIDASDGALHALCALGCGLALLLAGGRAPRSTLFGLWLAYLSFASVGSPFLDFQWDALLLEALLLSIVFAAPGPRAARAGLWLLRLLLLKLMLSSGLVKLLSGDESWWDGSALSFHYWTQPLPAWSSTLANELPAWAQRASTFATLAVEIVAPLGILGPRRVRLAACAALIGLQGLIGATGSYGIFNLLTVALCLTLLDDAVLARFSTGFVARILARPPLRASAPSTGRLATLRRVGFGALVIALLALCVLSALPRLAPRNALPEPMAAVLEAVRPFRSANAYGLFAVMTKQRPEIELEGSRDGTTWEPYVFRWKPGPVDRRPAFAAPHMPRLDWQMWFAALGSCAREPWLHAFLARLLEGSPDVSALLARDPFAGAPPRYLRSTLWRYRFAPAPDRHRGVWWTRERVGPYCPTLTLEDGQLRAAQVGD